MPAPTRDELRARIAERVREQAARRRITLDRLAAAAGVSRTALYNVTAGRGGVTVETLHKLAQALDVDPVVFLRPYKDGRMPVRKAPAGDAALERGASPGRKRKTRAKSSSDDS